MPAVVAGQDKVRAGAVKLSGEEELRISDDDVTRVGRVDVDDGSRRSVTTLPRKRSSHSPPFLGVNQKIPIVPVVHGRPVPTPSGREAEGTMLYSDRLGNKNVKER